ncbi:MAG: response regulator [Blastocatellia bacterium]|nr:response regulator [Blastocatellia bacterium]
MMANRILLVDDDEMFRSVAAVALEDAGYKVFEAADAFEALELLREIRPDAIISDLNMPLMDGRALCKRVRGQPDLAAIPFVILSAYIEADCSDCPPEGQEIWADCCFSKLSPFSSLLPRLEILIEQRN